MKGFLTKQGHVIKNWQVRYFLIKEKELIYYVDQTMAKEKGRIILDTTVSAISENSIENHENCFSIHTPSKVFFLSSPSFKEKQNWINAIKYITKGELTLNSKDVDDLHDPIVYRGWIEKKGQKKKKLE